MRQQKDVYNGLKSFYFIYLFSCLIWLHMYASAAANSLLLHCYNVKQRHSLTLWMCTRLDKLMDCLFSLFYCMLLNSCKSGWKSIKYRRTIVLLFHFIFDDKVLPKLLWSLSFRILKHRFYIALFAYLILFYIVLFDLINSPPFSW